MTERRHIMAHEVDRFVSVLAQIAEVRHRWSTRAPTIKEQEFERVLRWQLEDILIKWLCPFDTTATPDAPPRKEP